MYGQVTTSMIPPSSSSLSISAPHICFSLLVFFSCLAFIVNKPTDGSIEYHTGHSMIQCVTPFGSSRLISPEDISARILTCLRVSAETYLKRRPVKDVHCGGEELRGGKGRGGEGRTALVDTNHICSCMNCASITSYSCVCAVHSV